ncbi:MAG: cadherin-like domain-containing protein, partial [Gammaproteobacteria bacterium]|nr:cadherin-like domain-containing protein [Gammaproteobacteria bacterium]
TISYSLASQTVAGGFSVTSDGKILVADGTKLDFESHQTHYLTIRSTDTDGNTDDRVIAVELRDLVETSHAPTDLAGGLDLNTDGGNNAYLASADPTSVFDSVTSELTLEVSFSLEHEHEKDSPLLSYANADGADVVTLIVRADASVAFAINNQTLVTSPYAELRDGEQHMLSVSWDSDNGDVSLYIDGRLVETVTGHQAGEVISSGGVLVFGQEQDSVGGGFTTDEVFSGTYYETRIWSEVRSADEISLNYQHRLSSGALPSALAAYWKMDGFNGSNEVVESVAAENLRIGNVVGSGFSTSSPAESLSVAENSADGSSVSVVIPEDSVLHQDLVRDGRFLEADSGGWATYTQGQTFGGWRVVAGSVDHSSQFPSPLGGVGIDLERGVGDPGGVIAQTLSTEVGREYQIIFSATGNFSGSGDPVKFMRVSAAGVAQDFAITDTSVYETYSLRFTATSTSTELFLQGLDDSGFGAVVSDVRVLTIPDAITGILASDSDLHYDAGTGKFYKVVTSPADWISAQSLAAADQINGVGGQLVNILSQYENDLVQDMVTGKGSTFLIGATDATLEGNWNWLNNGEESESFWIGDGSGYSPTGTYSNFQSPEPDGNGGAEEDYAGMVASSGSWFDRGTGADNYIIEWDAGEVLGSYSFSLSDDAGGRFSIDETTGEITVADGSLLDFESQTFHVVDVDVIDAAGNGYSESLTIEVENLGAEPTQILPAPQVLPDSNLSLIFSLAGGNPVSVSDTDAGTDMRLQVTLEVSDGILTLSGTNGLLIPAGSNGSSSFTIQGTESDINAALEGMTFTPDVGFSGVVNLSMSTSLAVGLEGHYTFDGGDSMDQSVGSPQHGILSGGAAVTTDGIRGDVASLDGIDDFVLINSLFDSPADVTLAAWVDLDSIGTFGSEVISLGDNVMLRLDSDVGGLSLWYFNGSSFVSVTTDIYLEGTGWHHVAASFDDTSDQVAIYLNGESIKSESTTDSIVYSLGSSTLIGAHGNWANTYYFGGKIDDARIYSRVLSAAEVAVLARDRGSVSSSTTITVNAVNDIPVFSSLDGGQTYEEGAQPVIIDPNVAIFDAELSALDNYAGASLEIVRSGGADSNDVFSAVGSLAPLTQGGALTLSGVMIGTVDHNTSGKLQFTFNSNATEARVVETLRSLAYSNVNDSPANLIVLNWTFRDGNSGTQGTGGEGQATGNALVNITSINDVASATDDLAVTTEDSPLVINPLANDSDVENDPLTLLDVAQPTNGVVSNNGDGTLTYTPQANFHGTDAVDYLLIDAGTGLQHYWGLNGQAVDAAGGADGVVAGASQSNGDFGGALIFDEIDDHVVLPDIVYGSEFSISLEFKVKEINGSLYQYLYSHGDLNATNSINIFINENAHSSDPAVLRTVVRDGDDTLDHTTLQFDISTLVGDDLWHNYTLVAGADGLSVYLDGVLVATDATRGADGVNPTGAAMLGARFDLDNAQRYGGALDSVQVFNRALSASEVGSLTSAENSATVNLTINSVNDAPLSVSVSNTVLNENTDTGSGFTVGFLTSTDDDSGDTFTYTVVGGADSAVFSIGGAASDELVITAGVLDHESQSSYSVVIRTTDAAGASHDETLTITITDLNETPQVLSLSNSTIAENTDTTGGVVVGNLSGIDPDAGDTLTFSIAGGPDASVFSIGGAGLDELVITDGVLDFEAKATYSVTVRSTDTGGLFREQVFVVNVVDGNEQPTNVSLSNSTVSENTDSSAGYSVGTLSTTDQDIGDSFTYSIVGGADAGVLSIGGINSDELVLTDGTLDYERQTSYTVIVRTTDAGGLTRDQVLSVSVLDINEAPYSLTISNQLVSESSDASAGLSVGLLSTLDSDTGDSFTYTVIGGPDAGLFSIEGADNNELVITVGALDFESQSAYSVTVRSTDASGLFFDQVLLISVADQNEAPYFASFPPGPASTGTPYSYAIVAQDQDAGDVLSISANLLPDWLDLESSGSGSALLSGTPSVTDLGSHTVELVVTDGSLTAIQNFTVIVSNPDAPPVITSGGGSESHFLTLQENQALITTVTAEDADPGDVLTYSVSGGDDAGRFEIDATSGVLRFLIAPDFEAPQDHDTDSIYTAEITVADATGKVDSQLISVQIIDVNEPITSVTLDNTVVVENTDADDSLVVGTFSVSDQDLVDSVSYTIVGGADAASFSIGGPQLDLLMLTHSALDFETQPLLEVTVQATDSGGNGFDQSLEIGIADLNEPPQLLSAPAVLATEDSQYSYTLAATDPDAGAQLVLSVETLPQWLSL